VDVAEQVGLSLWKTRLMIAAAQTIFHLPIPGEFPVLLAEAKYNADREFTLAIVLDAAARRPVP